MPNTSIQHIVAQLLKAQHDLQAALLHGRSPTLNPALEQMSRARAAFLAAATASEQPAPSPEASAPECALELVIDRRTGARTAVLKVKDSDGKVSEHRFDGGSLVGASPQDIRKLPKVVQVYLRNLFGATPEEPVAEAGADESAAPDVGQAGAGTGQTWVIARPDERDIRFTGVRLAAVATRSCPGRPHRLELYRTESGALVGVKEVLENGQTDVTRSVRVIQDQDSSAVQSQLREFFGLSQLAKSLYRAAALEVVGVKDI